MTSRLLVGTPRIPAKPPRRLPCGDTRWNSFPSMDSIIARTGRGSGTEIAEYDPVIDFQIIFPVANTVVGLPSIVAGFVNNGLSIETADPPSGNTYYAFAPGSNPFASTCAIELITGWTCTPTIRQPYSSVCLPGELVTVTYRSKASTTSGAPAVRAEIGWLDGVSNNIANAQTTVALTTSYVTRSFAAVAPVNTEYVLVRVVFDFSVFTAAWSIGEIAMGIA